jgi:hypothetical protein
VIKNSIKLLGFKATRFSTYFFLENLFKDNRDTPFYPQRGILINCILEMQSDRILQRTVNRFETLFEHLRHEADFADMDNGYLQLILMLAKFVLGKLEVNLSIKESALNVAHDILDRNPRVRNIDLVDLTVTMMKTNYTGNTLSNYLSKLIKRSSPDEILILLGSLFEYDPVARQKFLIEINKMTNEIMIPDWLVTMMWVMQFDDDYHQLARDIWNKFDMKL